MRTSTQQIAAVFAPLGTDGVPCPECLSAGPHAPTCSVLRPFDIAERRTVSVALPLGQEPQELDLKLFASLAKVPDGRRWKVTVCPTNGMAVTIVGGVNVPLHQILNRLVEQCAQLKAVA